MNCKSVHSEIFIYKSLIPLLRVGVLTTIINHRQYAKCCRCACVQRAGATNQGLCTCQACYQLTTIRLRALSGSSDFMDRPLKMASTSKKSGRFKSRGLVDYAVVLCIWWSLSLRKTTVICLDLPGLSQFESYFGIWFVPWHRFLSGLLPQRLTFKLMPFWGFLVYKVTLGQLFLRVLQFSPVSVIPPFPHTRLSPTLYNLSSWSVNPLAPEFSLKF